MKDFLLAALGTALLAAAPALALNEEAVIPVGSTPAEFDKHIRAELARWAKVIKAAKIELE